MKVLIVEDSPDIVEAVTLAFQIRWPEADIVCANRGSKGVEMVETEKPNVVILDLGLPDISGFEVLKQIRLFSNVPILILTVRHDEPDIVKGLEWGADDYMVKPFRQLELLSRVKALLRRANEPGKEPPLVCGPLSLNPATAQLTCGDSEISLTPTESRLLHRLMKHAGEVVTHASLAEAVWGNDYPDAADSIKVYIHRLRQKLEADPTNPRLLLSKAGIGYLLVKPG
ncbi:MAG: response regulator transcription factor [Chloroflexi bacterium]|nr:response regulator transcription factor [Chloroflexota bacterium]